MRILVLNQSLYLDAALTAQYDAVGSPCLYVGAISGHITELNASVPLGLISCSGHGDAAAVVDRIRRSAALGSRRSTAYARLAERFGRPLLVPKSISTIEGAGQVADKCATAGVPS
jgi:hypothetical protein